MKHQTYEESIMASLNVIADKVDPDGDVNDILRYRDSSKDVIAVSLERIAEHFEPGSGGDSGDSLVKAADVRFVTDDSNITLEECFYIFKALPVYCPSSEGYAETSGIFPSDGTIEDWNADADNKGYRIIAPYVLYKLDDNLTYTLEGDAEFGIDDDDAYIYITGDCTITIQVSK